MEADPPQAAGVSDQFGFPKSASASSSGLFNCMMFASEWQFGVVCPVYLGFGRTHLKGAAMRLFWTGGWLPLNPSSPFLLVTSTLCMMLMDCLQFIPHV